MASHLLNSRRFLPLLLTQFLGALNDHFFKTAVVMLMTYRAADNLHIDPMNLVAISGAFFILPYTFFCATSGKLADKFDKATIARIIKYCELGFMVLATIGFYFHLLSVLFLVLFCMGTHSAFFSPVKYALLPDHLRTDELMEGNAFIEGCTFIAILLGTIAGGTLVLRPHGEILVSSLMISIALCGIFTSRFIPPATTRDASVQVRYNIFRETREVFSYMVTQKILFKTSLANSWFWFICVAFMSLFPLYTRKNIGADEDVATLFLTAFAIGIGIGTVACGALLKGKTSVKYVPISALVMSLFIFDLYLCGPHANGHYTTLISLAQFLAQPQSWRMIIDLFIIAFAGGFYIVPLYAQLQQRCEARHRAQVMACNSVLNALFMIVSAVMAFVMCQLGHSVADVFLVVGSLNVGAGFWLFTPAGSLR